MLVSIIYDFAIIGKIMKILVAFSFGIMISFVGFATYVRAGSQTNQLVLPETQTTPPVKSSLQATPTESPKPTPSPSPPPTLQSVAETPKPTVNATPFIGNLSAIFDQYAGQYGVDPNYLRHIAQCESGFNPSAVNGPYTGLFQFHVNTWAKYRKEMGMDPSGDLRVNAEEAIRTAAYVVSRFGTNFWPNCH